MTNTIHSANKLKVVWNLLKDTAGEWSRGMERTHHFWEVASIIWTAGDKRVQEINRYHNEVP